MRHKLRKKSLKSAFLDFKVVQGHQCKYTRKVCQYSVVLVMLNSKFLSICDRFHAKLLTVAEIAHLKISKFESSIRRTP